MRVCHSYIYRVVIKDSDKDGWRGGRGGQVRSIVPDGTQTSSIRVPPIIWRVSASRTRVQPASTDTIPTPMKAERSALPRCATWRCLPRCVEPYLYMATDCAAMYSSSGNRSSNLPRNCKVTLGVKFIRETRAGWRHELRASPHTNSHEKRGSRCWTPTRCQTRCQTRASLCFYRAIGRTNYCCLRYCYGRKMIRVHLLLSEGFRFRFRLRNAANDGG